MNSANENLRSIRNHKAEITKAYNQALEKLNRKYESDMAVLNEEEKKLLEEFDDVPIEDIYKEE